LYCKMIRLERLSFQRDCGRCPPAVLPLEMLEHEAYYAGKLGVAPAGARRHAKKRGRSSVCRTEPRPRVGTDTSSAFVI
jgi:hypothetical protein